ncbi:hypothetical protein GCM10027275_07460 [Rhabdobacter roseus]|uniref:Uncharacterized protein n=1 Tax=Rhabdobacter roseus TaxID=1655419 RepID=A0A840TI71_9BACT|nr:hypothetical protein [Rhabdobacter roseus]MBB5282645.1 hypothetical protein [Rhabdobacter roseus]
MARNQDIKRQAVVIIHGIGEQRPMDTLRSFVEGLTFWIKKEEPQAERPRYWSRPDGISEIYETHRITMEQFQMNPKTDFYEFYWAHHMRNTSFAHLVPWVWKLITTRLSQVPPRLKPIFYTLWATLVAMVVLGGVIYTYHAAIWAYVEAEWPSLLGIIAVVLAVVRVLYGLVKVPFSSLVLNTAGDAARYFNPMPSNIEERSTIRREGITFLRKLHDRKTKPYDRIVVVGHSLGSVVAYDMIRLLWHEMHERFTPGADVDHDVFEEMDKISRGDEPLGNINDFQQLQYRCWKQYRQNGNPWLISDFITVAGAIAHADVYLLNSKPFQALVKQKEFPICPPVMEGRDKTLFFDRLTAEVDVNGKKEKRTVRFLNHAAPFALTRWTNIYFSSDYVGSDGQRIFGKGVRDIKVDRRGLWFLPSGHTNYWDAIKDNQALSDIATAMGFKQAK